MVNPVNNNSTPPARHEKNVGTVKVGNKTYDVVIVSKKHSLDSFDTSKAHNLVTGMLAMYEGKAKQTNASLDKVERLSVKGLHTPAQIIGPNFSLESIKDTQGVDLTPATKVCPNKDTTAGDLWNELTKTVTVTGHRGIGPDASITSDTASTTSDVSFESLTPLKKPSTPQTGNTKASEWVRTEDFSNPNAPAPKKRADADKESKRGLLTPKEKKAKVVRFADTSPTPGPLANVLPANFDLRSTAETESIHSSASSSTERGVIEIDMDDASSTDKAPAQKKATLSLKERIFGKKPTSSENEKLVDILKKIYTADEEELKELKDEEKIINNNIDKIIQKNRLNKKFYILSLINKFNNKQ